MARWSRAPNGPFGAGVARVPLEPDTLERVVAQIQFTPVLSVREQSFIAAFQESVRGCYPLFHNEVQQRVGHGDQGALQVSDTVIWRFQDVSEIWQISLSEDFASLDCTDYSHRDDFARRLRQTLDAVGRHIRPVLTTRVGVRYTNRFRGAAYERLSDFIRPELLGMTIADLDAGDMLSQLTQAEFKADGVHMYGRWGSVPAGTAPDASLETLDEASWLLDLDAFAESMAPFDVGSCAQDALRFSDVVYNFFRWAVSDEFLDAYGVSP